MLEGATDGGGVEGVTDSGVDFPADSALSSPWTMGLGKPRTTAGLRWPRTAACLRETWMPALSSPCTAGLREPQTAALISPLATAADGGLE